jgi:hypothetical protein
MRAATWVMQFLNLKTALCILFKIKKIILLGLAFISLLLPYVIKK